MLSLIIFWRYLNGLLKYFSSILIFQIVHFIYCNNIKIYIGNKSKYFGYEVLYE